MVHPGKGKAQQEEKEGVKRKWHREEIEAANRGWLVSRNEKGWITNSRTDWVASVVSCGYCGEERISKGTNYVRMDYAHDMWCEKCGPKREWLNREVAAGRKSKMRCTECGKKWVAAKKEKVEAGECNKCEESRRRKEAA